MRMPKFAEEIQLKYKSNVSNSFILTGNINDYVYNTDFLKDYLIDFLRNNEMAMDEIYLYDIQSQGNTVINKNEMKNGSWEQIVKAISDSETRNAFIFFYPQYLIPAGDYLQEEDKKRIVSLHTALNSSAFLSSNNVVIFITDTTAGINSLFLDSNSRMTVINIELPDLEERMDFISYWFSGLSDDDMIEMKITKRELANLTAGLQLTAIEDILLLGLKTFGYIDNEMVMTRKQEVIKKEFNEVIEIFDTKGFSLKDFAGQEDIKTYFKEVVIDAVRNNDLDIVPKGVMLMGPPGTGKTFFARCLAGDAGINFVEFKMSKILGKYVGESEKSMEKALSVFRALAPVGVFMDEIDQSLSRGNNDGSGSSSVNSNIFGMLLAEMSKPENRGKIIWIAATNYPNNVDEALKRAGRFDKKIPFFAPTEEEREAVISLHLKKAINKGFALNNDININYLAKETEGYTQAEIEAVIVKALELCRRAKMKEITEEKLELALKYMLSAQNDKIKEMEDIALIECNDQEFIPEKYRDRHRKLMRQDTTTNNDYGSVNRRYNSR